MLRRLHSDDESPVRFLRTDGVLLRRFSSAVHAVLLHDVVSGKAKLAKHSGETIRLGSFRCQFGFLDFLTTDILLRYTETGYVFISDCGVTKFRHIIYIYIYA